MIFMILLTSLNKELRYVKYFLPLVSGFIFLANWKHVDNRYSKVSKIIIQYFLFYLVLSFQTFFVILSKNDFHIRVISNISFIFIPIITIFFISKFYNSELLSNEFYLKKIFLYLVCFFIISKITLLKSIVSSLNFNSLLSSLYSSSFQGESTLAFVFGLFTIFFLVKKEKKFFYISLLFSLISFKRIVLIALVLIIILFPLIKVIWKKYNVTYNKKAKIIIPILLVIINFSLVHFYRNFAYGEFDQTITEITGKSANFLSMGRQYFFRTLFDHYGGTPWLGIGIGRLDEFLHTEIIVINNLHSDILKNYFEFGVISFAFWLFFIYYISIFSIEVFLLTIYMNIVFITDNVFIYFTVLFFYYLFIVICYGKYIYSVKNN